VLSSTLEGNVAAGPGGALWTLPLGAANFIQSTVSGNSALSDSQVESIIRNS